MIEISNLDVSNLKETHTLALSHRQNHLNSEFSHHFCSFLLLFQVIIATLFTTICRLRWCRNWASIRSSATRQSFTWTKDREWQTSKQWERLTSKHARRRQHGRKTLQQEKQTSTSAASCMWRTGLLCSFSSRCRTSMNSSVVIPHIKNSYTQEIKWFSWNKT